jgi:hypothetical protein
LVREAAPVVGPLAAGVLVMVVVWFSSESARTRCAYLVAVLGSFALCVESVSIALCSSAENIGDVCHPAARHWVLLWIPVLFGGAWVVSRTRGSWAWALHLSLLILALLVPYAVLN